MSRFAQASPTPALRWCLRSGTVLSVALMLGAGTRSVFSVLRVTTSATVRAPHSNREDVMLQLVLGLITATAVVFANATSGVAEPAMSLEFDGTTHVFVPQMEGARTGFTRFSSVDAIGLEGADGQMRLVLELALPPGSETGDAPHDARISFRPNGFRDYWVSPPDLPDGTIIIEYLDLSGHAPRIAGHFAVPLCFAASPIHMLDQARCLPASGQFDTALARD